MLFRAFVNVLSEAILKLMIGAAIVLTILVATGEMDNIIDGYTQLIQTFHTINDTFENINGQ